MKIPEEDQKIFNLIEVCLQDKAGYKLDSRKSTSQANFVSLLWKTL